MVDKKDMAADWGGQFDIMPPYSLHQASQRNPNKRSYGDANVIRWFNFFRENPIPIFALGPDGAVIKLNSPADRLLTCLQIQQHDILPSNHLQIVRDCLVTRRDYSLQVPVADRIFALTYNPISSFQLVYLYVVDITDEWQEEGQFLQLSTDTTAIAKHAVLQRQIVNYWKHLNVVETSEEGTEAGALEPILT